MLRDLTIPVLKPETVNAFYKLFQIQRWGIEDVVDRAFDHLPPDPQSKRFDIFCAFLEQLSSDERELILTLTESFLYCDDGQYKSVIRRLLKKCAGDLLTNHESAFLLPIVKEHDRVRGKPKSSGTVAYLARAATPLFKSSGCDFTIIDDPTILQRNHSDRKNAIIIFVDDFIGTGRTTINVITSIRERSIFNNTDEIVVLSLIALRDGLGNIRDTLNIKCYTGKQVDKGISCSTMLDNVDDAIRIMKQLETRINISEKYRFGFGQSEALVAMENTPNNTFPVYWCSHQVEGEEWPAPFKRW